LRQLGQFEIDEKTQRNVEELHVTEKLGFMDGCDLFDRFYFNEYTPLNQDIEAQWLFFNETLVRNKDDLLIGYFQAPQFEFTH